MSLWIRQLVWWTADLLPDDLRATAFAELAAEGAAPPVTPPVEPIGDTLGRLLATDTVLAADAALPQSPDWPGLAAAHAREPFGRVHARALIARPDCPEEFVFALIEPWDSLVAGRLNGRRAVPDRLVRPVAERLGEIRPSLIRLMLNERTATEFIHVAPRLSGLVDVVNGYDHNHSRQQVAFWNAIGALLAPLCGTDRERWLAAATNVATWPGTFTGLVRRLGTPVLATDDPDLRVLAYAPDTVLADVMATLPDPRFRRVRDDRPLKALILERLVTAGVPAREVFALWTYGSFPSTAVHVWAHGHFAHLDTSNHSSACYKVELRTRLAAVLYRDQGPVVDLVAELRACTTAVQAEAILLTQGGIPWPELVEAHQAEPLPGVVACALASRPEFPAELIDALPEYVFMQLAPQNPATARAALANPKSSHRSVLFREIHRHGTLSDDEIFDTARTARDLVTYLARLDPADPQVERYAATIRAAAASAPPGFWSAFLRLLPTAESTLGEFLASVAQP